MAKICPKRADQMKTPITKKAASTGSAVLDGYKQVLSDVSVASAAS